MTYKTHLAFATAVTLLPLPLLPLWTEYNPFYYITSPVELAIIAGLIYVSSLAPDFDEPNSYLSSRFPWIIISIIISLFTKHRGVTHYFIASFFYLGIFAAPALFYFGKDVLSYAYMSYFLVVPYIMHSVGDGFTKGGIPRFWYPFSKKLFGSFLNF